MTFLLISTDFTRVISVMWMCNFLLFLMEKSKFEYIFEFQEKNFLFAKEIFIFSFLLLEIKFSIKTTKWKKYFQVI